MNFVIDVFSDSEKYFESQLQQYQYFDKYSRFDYQKGRRETWKETVQRAVKYLRQISENKLDAKDYDDIERGILNMDVMPSMRLLAMAGDAANAFPQSIYNCAFLRVNSVESFVEILNLSMNGVGIGFSVQKKYVSQIEKWPRGTIYSNCEFVIEDSTSGWCEAFRFGLERWLNGNDVEFDYSQIRPAGSVLKTKGGRASGHLPLKNLLDFTRNIILHSSEDRLSSVDVYDIVCKIGDCVVSGGHRRTAFLCLFDYNDNEMLQAKNGNSLIENPHRYNSNNSVVLPKRELTQKEILHYFMQMDSGGNGEPGLFSPLAAKNNVPYRRDKNYEFGTNACGEVVLRHKQFCNLSSVVCREGDTAQDLERKVKLATIIGTIQSCVTNFTELSNDWKENCESERLLGVDLNGQMDCPVIRDGDVQNRLRMVALSTNIIYSKKLNMRMSRAITTVKPSGNSGVLLNVSSGIHPRWSKYYIRNVRVSKTSPLYKVLIESGVALSPENGQTELDATSYVASFPMKSPDGAITRHDTNAIWQLNYFKQVLDNWSEHNVSCTVYYDDNEIIDVVKWLYDSQDYMGGLSFLPKLNATYLQAPYIEITKEEYEKLINEFPKIDFSLLQKYESEDLTTLAQEVACSAGQCDFAM